MTNRDGTPIWYELMTDAPDVAQDFYGKVMGWTFEKQQGGSDNDYLMFAAAGEGVGGVMRTPEHAKGRPATWDVYFGATDVDAMATKVKDLGGTIHMQPQDIQGVGRFAFVADPQGATFYLMRGDSDGQSTAFDPAKPGHCSWNELVTSDQTAALAFYSKLFDWKKTGAMPMGPDGDYTFVGQSDADMVGAMMNAEKADANPFWNFAFNVPDIDRAKLTVEENGGTVTHGPIDLPGDEGDWLIQVKDPQGARVMFVGKRTDRAA